MKRFLAWWASNGVAANLLMALILVGGAMTAFLLRQEVFPEFSADLISVSVVYPGAAPAEVEDGVVSRIEEAVDGVEGVEEITSTAAEGAGSVLLELIAGEDPTEVLDDVKNRVDAIDTFPEEAEEPLIQELVIRRQVISIAVSGPTDEGTLRHLAERVRDDLALMEGITQVELAAARPYEISIEVSEDALRRYGLTFAEVAEAMRRASLDLPGGSVRTEGGEILLRTQGQAYWGEEFEKLVLFTRPDGTRIQVGDVAAVVDGFAETDQAARFDGEPAILVKLFRVGDQDAVEIAEKAKAYVAEARKRLPPGISLTTWEDDTKVLRSRLDTLLRSGRAGLVLVILVLALFLNLRLAGWVSLGIPISFLGALGLMPVMGLTINLISLFAFIVVLGIVVDDAIVVGENIYRHHQEGKEGLEAAVDGAHQVAHPVIFAILTTVAAFAPLLFVPGTMGKVMKVIPLIVIAVLFFSLVESLLILPAHLSHLRHDRRRSSSRLARGWRKIQHAVARGLRFLTDRSYTPSLEWAIEWRYLSLAIAVGALLVTAGVVGAGWIRFTFFPPVEADNVVAMLTMPQGTPADVTSRTIRRIEEEALRLQDEIEERTGEDVFRHVLTTVGEQPFRLAQQHGGGAGKSFSGAHLGEVNIELVSSEERETTSAEIADLWRERVGSVADAVELTFTSSLFSAGDAIHVRLAGSDIESLRQAADELQAEIRGYPGVEDVSDSFRAGKKEIELEVTPEAESLGLRLADVASQVRQAFYGEEVQRIQRGREEVKVMVRLPAEDRRSLGDLEDLRIRGPEGIEVPFSVAGRASYGRGFATIQRADRHRTVDVTADVDEKEGNAGEIIADLQANVLPGLLADHPGIRASFEGEQAEQRETIGGLQRGFALALMVIYVLLAVPFRSYLQPLVVMSAIPFGLIGAVGGHMMLGLNLTILSGFGIVALTGVVVNDSLIMVDFINQSFRAGVPLEEAIRRAGRERFRPILITSLTTFVGLTPLILERSVQAQFLIPMAVSLAFGVLFATAISLVLVPVLYAIHEDIKAAGARAMSALFPSRPSPGPQPE